MTRIVRLLFSVALITFCSNVSSQDLENTVVIRTTGGAFEQQLKKHFFEPFTAATGIKVVPVAVSYGEMLAKTKAMSQAGRVEWDIISPIASDAEGLKDVIEDLGDCSSIPNVSIQGIPGTCKRYGVLYLIGGRPIVVNDKLLPNKRPSSWIDFWDVKNFPGPRAMPNEGAPWNEIIAALLADGVPKETLFPLDLDRAFKKLDEIKPYVQVWWKTGDQSQQLMRSGEVAMNIMWSGRAFASAQRGDPITWTYNQTVADLAVWAVLKNAPHPRAAKAFIDFYMQNPQAHAAFSREMGYATSSKAGQELLSPELRAQLAATPEAMQNLIQIDGRWLAENKANVVARWNSWVSQ